LQTVETISAVTFSIAENVPTFVFFKNNDLAIISCYEKS